MTKWVCNGFEFNVGDKVRVAQVLWGMNNGIAWENEWTEGMDEYVGHEFLIDCIDQSGVYFKDNVYGWPLSALVQVEEACVAETKLPDGLFSLEDVFGNVFKATARSKNFTHLEYESGIKNTIVNGSFKNTDIISAIDDGDWEIIEEPYVALQKKKLELLKTQKQALNNEMLLLIADIAKLEKEIAQ